MKSQLEYTFQNQIGLIAKKTFTSIYFVLAMHLCTKVFLFFEPCYCSCTIYVQVLNKINKCYLSLVKNCLYMWFVKKSPSIYTSITFIYNLKEILLSHYSLFIGQL